MRKSIKYVLIAIAFFALVIFLLSTYFKSQALKKIASTEGINCHNLHFNLLTGCLDLEKLEIDRSIGENESDLLKFSSNRAHLHGFGYWQFWKNNRIVIADLITEDLEIQIMPNIVKETTSDTTQQKGNAPIEEIFIDKIDLQQGSFVLQNANFKEIRLDSFVAQIEQFHVFPKKDSGQIVWKKVAFLGQQFLMDGKESDNRLMAESIELTNDEQVEIKAFQWKPKYSKSNYLKHHPYRKARLDLVIPKITIQEFPIHEVIFQQQFKAQSITTQDGIFKIYSDKNKAACTDCLKSYPYEDLIDTDWLVDIDSIAIKNSEIVLQQLEKGKTKAGKLDWSNVYASIYNLTNNKTKAKTHPNTVADIKATFVKDGQVALHFEIPNFNKNAAYSFHGSLDEVKLKKINSFLVFSKQFRIKQGEVSAFAFRGSGNLMSASGEMELRYRNLELQLLKKDRTPRKFLSKVANAIFGKKNNPDKENELRKGKMYFERDKSKSFISNWWKTLQSGIKSTMLPNILLPEELETTAK